MMRFDAQLYFANSNFFKENAYNLISGRKKPKFFILDASPICKVDSTSVHMLHDFIMELKGEGITFLFANLIGPVKDTLNKSSLTEIVNAEESFMSVKDAYEYAVKKLG